MRRIERNPEYSLEVRFDDNLIECYEKAIELDPNYLIVKEELSKLHKKNIKKIKIHSL